MADQEAGIASFSSISQRSEGHAQLNTKYYLTAGLEGVEGQDYRSIRSFSKAIDAHCNAFRSGNWRAGQYLVFLSVTQKHIADIHHLRERRHKGLGWMYLKSKGVLIVKIILSGIQEMVYLEFGSRLRHKADQMGLRCGLCGIGRTSTTFEGLIGQKEGDSTFKPMRCRRPTDWLTIVFECGLSESLECLRVDSRWWLENSTKVRIVLLLSNGKCSTHRIGASLVTSLTHLPWSPQSQ